jgi:dihydrofolate reductase
MVWPQAQVDFVPTAMQGDQSFGRDQLKLIDSIDMILLGRVTYQMFSQYWPHVTRPDEKAFADKVNATPKIVFSKKLDRAPWGSWDEAQVVNNSAAGALAKLTRQAGKDMLIWGSLSVAQSLMNLALIDEYQLVVCPVVIGSGRPLFRDKVDTFDLKLMETKPFDRGAVLLKYRPANARSSD